MVHQTFYKLPEEKRRRITDSAMDEFTSRPYEKTSINRIIEAARIPKGSFYQYFDSKDDLYAYCVKELSRRLLEQRRERHERLLDTGLHRVSRVGMGQAVDEYNAELNSMLGEKGSALLSGLSDAPRALRNSVLLEIAVDLIMPVMREELEADPEVRRDADLDFFAYLLSIGDALSIDYGGMTHAGDLNRLTYEYTEAIYSALKRR